MQTEDEDADVDAEPALDPADEMSVGAQLKRRMKSSAKRSIAKRVGTGTFGRAGQILLLLAAS